MDGESLVMHVGDRPYVVTESGQVGLAKAPLALASMEALIDELVPPAARRALDQTGATQFVLAEHPLLPGHRFTVVAATGADDAWLEIRRVSPSAARDMPLQSQGTWGGDRATQSYGGSKAETDTPRPAVVYPLVRPSIRPEAQPPRVEHSFPGLEPLLRLALARGASALYLSSGAVPVVRVDGALEPLDGVPVFEATQVEALLLALTPERTAEALREQVAGEWTSEVGGFCRVRCQVFRDHRGPGGVLRLMPARVPTVEQLGVSKELLALATGGDGLVVIAGPRASGKRTLMSAFVDHLARVSRAHVITVERDVTVAHGPAAGLVSQREVVRPSDMPDIVRAALREDPDVLVIEDLGSATLLDLALDAAAPGRLVLCGCAARSASAAVDRLIDLAPPSARARVQLALAHTLRGVVSQVLVRKVGGGRVAARELLLNTPAVASILADGRTAQLPAALEGGRAQGMYPLHETLAAYVASGTIDAGQAYGAAVDKAALLAALERRGVDVTGLERLG